MTEPMTVTIGYFELWATAKLIAAFFLVRQEMKTPVWKTHTEHGKRGANDMIRMIGRHVFWGLEWGTVKMLVFAPIWLFTGTKYLNWFLPWKIPSPPPACSICKDRGQIRVENTFVEGSSTRCYEQCACQKKTFASRWLT